MNKATEETWLKRLVAKNNFDSAIIDFNARLDAAAQSFQVKVALARQRIYLTWRIDCFVDRDPLRYWRITTTIDFVRPSVAHRGAALDNSNAGTRISGARFCRYNDFLHRGPSNDSV